MVHESSGQCSADEMLNRKRCSVHKWNFSDVLFSWCQAPRFTESKRNDTHIQKKTVQKNRNNHESSLILFCLMSGSFAAAVNCSTTRDRSFIDIHKTQRERKRHCATSILTKRRKAHEKEKKNVQNTQTNQPKRSEIMKGSSSSNTKTKTFGRLHGSLPQHQGLHALTSLIASFVAIAQGVVSCVFVCLILFRWLVFVVVTRIAIQHHNITIQSVPGGIN